MDYDYKKMWQEATDLVNNKKQYAAAVVILDVMDAVAEQYNDFYYIRAGCKFNTKNYWGAIADAQKALEQKPEHTPAAMLMGNIYYKMRMLYEAIEAYSRVLYYNPEDYQAIFWRLMSRINFKDDKGQIYNHAAAQADANALLPVANQFFNVAKDGKQLPIVAINIGPDGNLNMQVNP